ncbi:hypothetical protein Acsp04_42700 [Actinomadura sp. NBRC 104425]|nr:hypothetical protein Acsp04_42700 [Actinomadura sp. NBRC 104425]
MLVDGRDQRGRAGHLRDAGLAYVADQQAQLLRQIIHGDKLATPATCRDAGVETRFNKIRARRARSVDDHAPRSRPHGRGRAGRPA